MKIYSIIITKCGAINFQYLYFASKNLFMMYSISIACLIHKVSIDSMVGNLTQSLNISQNFDFIRLYCLTTEISYS